MESQAPEPRDGSEPQLRGHRMKQSPAHRQEHVEDPILEVLEQGRTMTTAEITKATKAKLDLDPADLARANRRENESKIDQIIANALQEQRNLCKKGLIVRAGHGVFQITAKGHEQLATRREQMALMQKLADEMGMDGEWD